MNLPGVTAPEINTSHGWLNTDRAYSIKDFRGKIVLLDFWTYGCINCQHILPDLKKLEKEFARELVVIGVHSAKFDSEKLSNNIRKAILKFGIEHPVVNDADYKVWQSYAVNAWPTVVLIDPDGKVIGQKAGEGFYDTVRGRILELIGKYGDRINRQPFVFKAEADPGKALRFPSKMIDDGQGNLFVADSGHNRILKISRDGQILLVIGKGEQGFGNGSFAEATFYEPHGLALKGNYLYIADTKNNAIRRANLSDKTVETVAGNGEMGYYFFEQNWGVDVLPNSPWDLLIDGERMYIANAGNHQILVMNLNTHKTERFAGTGREALIDGPLKNCAFNQPSGLTKNGNILYIADSEASAVRALHLSEGKVATPLGKGLFDFGDVDGDVSQALLQHPVGINHRDGKIYIADTYNGKIRVLDLQKNRVSTMVAGLHEPNDILFINNELWVSSTNDHQLIKIDLATNQKTLVTVK